MSQWNYEAYRWSCTAGPHTANDGASQRQNDRKGAHDQNAQENTLVCPDVIAIVHCKTIREKN